MTENLYKYYRAYRLVQREIGEPSSFREMLDTLVENPQEGIAKDLPYRMRKILTDLDRMIDDRLS